MKEQVNPDWDCLWNLTFQYFYENFGEEALIKYYRHLANSDYYKKILDKIKQRGLEGVKEYWLKCSEGEGIDYSYNLENNRYVIRVNSCSAFKHFKENNIKPFERYCDYCEIVNQKISKNFSVKYKLVSCNNRGSCEYLFYND